MSLLPDAAILLGSRVKEIRIRSARFAEVVAFAAPLFFTLSAAIPIFDACRVEATSTFSSSSFLVADKFCSKFCLSLVS
jgi:hypothetical protein